MAIIKLQGEAERAKGIYYEVDADRDPIGEGGTGKVYEGRQVNVKTKETRPVAIKFMFADLSDQIVERARREASVQLRNDNLIEMLGFIETETYHNGAVQKHYHVVSELLCGVSLTDVFDGKCTDVKGNEIAFAKKLQNIYSKDPDHFAKIIGKNVLSGLMALHDAGYIHRDIDPSNIMITDDEHIKLIDFGICKQMDKLTTHDKVQTVAGIFMGKPEYAAPELALGDIKHQDQATDIYAVGILMYQCILGHVPFGGTRYEILDRQVNTKVPVKDIKNRQLRMIIQKACEKKPRLRYQTATEMRVDIESMDIRRATRPLQRRAFHIASAITVAIVLATAIGFYLSARQGQKINATTEKATRDSLTHSVAAKIGQAVELAQKGYLHDEGYDAHLVAAKRLFDEADAMAVEAGDTTLCSGYAEEQKRLMDALVKARDELQQKVELLKDDPDPIVAEEVGKIRNRVKEIASVIK